MSHSYDWIICAGVADCSGYDSRNQPDHSGIELTGRKMFSKRAKTESLFSRRGEVRYRLQKECPAIISKSKAGRSCCYQFSTAIESYVKVYVVKSELPAEQVILKAERKQVTGLRRC